MFSLGMILWIINAGMFADHVLLVPALGLFHAALAGLVIASAFMPRTVLRWP